MLLSLLFRFAVKFTNAPGMLFSPSHRFGLTFLCRFPHDPMRGSPIPRHHLYSPTHPLPRISPLHFPPLLTRSPLTLPPPPLLYTHPTSPLFFFFSPLLFLLRQSPALPDRCRAAGFPMVVVARELPSGTYMPLFSRPRGLPTFCTVRHGRVLYGKACSGFSCVTHPVLLFTLIRFPRSPQKGFNFDAPAGLVSFEGFPAVCFIVVVFSLLFGRALLSPFLWCSVFASPFLDMLPPSSAGFRTDVCCESAASLSF